MGKEGASFLSKHALKIVPTVLLAVNSILVVNNASYRDFSEKYLPSYVGFLRKNVGFWDEDLPEMDRVRAVLENESHAEALIVHLDNGTKIEVDNVIGSKLVGDVISETCGNVVNISFIENSGSSDGNTSNSNTSDVIRGVLAKSEWDNVTARQQVAKSIPVKGMVEVQNPAYSYNQYSLLNTKHAKHSNDFAYLDILLSNVGAYMAWSKRLPREAVQSSSKQGSRQQRQQESTRQEDDRASEEIDALQRKIVQLRLDVKNPYSARHIDDVEEDISKCCSELARLRRKRSWFYFF